MGVLKEPGHKVQTAHYELGNLKEEIHKAKQEARNIKAEAHKILEDAQSKLHSAETKASEILSKATKEAKRITQEAYIKTMKAATAEAEGLKKQSRDILKDLFEVKREALTQAHKEIIQVALDLAEKIIRYKVSIDPGVLETQVVEAIKKATSEADRVQVYVNSKDLQTIENNIPKMAKLFPSGVDIIPLANDSVDPGSCIIETKSGQLDARFSTQLQALTNLMQHLDVIEPVATPEAVTQPIKKIEEKIIKPVQIEQEQIKEDILADEELSDIEKDQLKEELLSEEENLTESIPFITTESKQVEPVYEELRQEVVQEPQRKETSFGDLAERTREEAEELDGGIEYLDDEDEGIYEEVEEENKDVKPTNVLRLKKQESNEVSKIASELEENPDWKDIVEGEDD